MARWDEIFSLPVQSPPSLEFSAADLVWTKVEGWRDKINRVALIPYARINDFVRGESSNKECPTRFHVEARRRRPPQAPYKPKVDGILEYILYWCSFGPDDHRKGGVIRPSRNTYIPKNKSSGRPNTKRGCKCHFIVKRLVAEPSVALIIYDDDKHVDEKGIPCHGPQDKKAAGTRAMFAPYISDDLRLRVLSLLHVGVSVETIMQRHNESVERQGGPSNRDDLLTHRYVRRLERSIRRSTYELDEDDAVSVGMWVESHQNDIFFYEDFSDSGPFILGIQTEWQLQLMIRFGNRSLIASDSRFGPNKLKYPVHTLLIFDSDNKAIPVAWIITSTFGSVDSQDKWIRALYNRVHSKDPAWKLAGFIIDDPSTDVLPIREVFQCSILICIWRVRHAWHKNLLKKCSETNVRVEISRRLGQAIYSICQGDGNTDLFDGFMEDFIDCSDFLDYFRAVWFPRTGTWTTALKSFPLASQETCAAMEYYHHQLKLRLLNEKDRSVYQRVDWLVNKLGTKIHSYFWLDEYSKKDDFARYRKDEWMSGSTSWRKALKIPDSDVILEGQYAKVVSELDREKVHIVWNPGSEIAICDCEWSKMGNLCMHIIKVTKVCHNKGSALPSISLLQYNRTLINMLQCAPHDSLIRDHAVTLSIYAQMQLNTLIDQGVQPALFPGLTQLQTERPADRVKDLKESQSATKNAPCNENAFGMGKGAGGAVAGEVVDKVVSEPCFLPKIDEQMNVCNEMEIDSLQRSPVPSTTWPAGDTVSDTGFLENGSRDLIDEDRGMRADLSSIGNMYTTENGIQDDMLVDNCQSHGKVFSNGFGSDVEGTITGSLMDVSPLMESSLSSVRLIDQRTSNDNGNCSDLAEPTCTGNDMDVNLNPCGSLSRNTPVVVQPVMVDDTLLI